MNWVMQYLYVVAAGSASRLERREAISTETLTENLKCPPNWTQCKDVWENICNYKGICCRKFDKSICVCQKCFSGTFCQVRDPFCQTTEFEAAGSAPRLERTAAMSTEALTEKIEECPGKSTPCGDPQGSFCNKRGICCKLSDRPKPFCKCEKCFDGEYCQLKEDNCTSLVAASGVEGTQLMAAFGSILGILLVCGLMAAVFLLMKCYKSREDQCQDDQEIKKSMLSSPEFGRKDEAFTKLTMAQPGQHPWKQKVNLIAHDSSKMKGLPSSNAFPWLQIEWTECSTKKTNQTKTNARESESICLFPADEGSENSSPTSRLPLDWK